MVWHMAFILEFENALLSVDPSIGALPYWDECLTEPSLFSDDYFGNDPEGEPYEVTSGKFAYWPISNFSIDDWAGYIVDDTFLGFAGSGDPNSTFLRGSENLVNNTYMTRYGSGSAWEASVGETCTEAFWDCAASTDNWIDWYACIENGNANYPSVPSFHSPHPVVGGRAGGGGRPPGGGGGPPPGGGGTGGGAPPGTRLLQGGGGGPTQRGDLEDPQTSPNSPLFMFFHANLDRNRLWWMQRHNTAEDKCYYYGFPTENAPRIAGRNGIIPGGANYDGAHLNDVSSSTMGFTATELGFDEFLFGNSSATGKAANTSYQVTNADLLCWMDASTAPYTYDTNLDCLADAAFCYPGQTLDPLVVYVEENIPDRPERPMEGQPEAISNSSSSSSSSTASGDVVATVVGRTADEEEPSLLDSGANIGVSTGLSLILIVSVVAGLLAWC